MTMPLTLSEILNILHISVILAHGAGTWAKIALKIVLSVCKKNGATPITS